MILAGTPAQRILEISGDMPTTPQNSPQEIQVKLIVEERRVQKVVISTDPRDKPHSDPQIAVPVDTYFRRIRIDPSPHQSGVPPRELYICCPYIRFAAFYTRNMLINPEARLMLLNHTQLYLRGLIVSSTTLSIGVASFSLRFYLYAGATFLAQAKACYSIL